MKRTLFCFMVSVFASVSLLSIAGTDAKADAVTDTIGVYIGYYGWSEDQFVEKAVYSWTELDDLFGGVLKTHEKVYSYYSGSRMYLAAARGFYIRDLLEYAAIDLGSIARIDFFTKDQSVGAYRSFTKESLLDMPRYYFPNLGADEESGELYAYDGGDIYDGAVRIDPMLALEDYTEWDSVGYLFEQFYNSEMFSPSSRFHLFFGQLAPTEANTSSAAKYVYKILLTFGGTPVLSAEESNIELKIGSEFQMMVNVAAEDGLLDDYVKSNLVWSSDNESVVSVDSTGRLAVINEGEAVISASFGGASVSVTVRVSGDISEVEDIAPTLTSNGAGVVGEVGEASGADSIVGMDGHGIVDETMQNSGDEQSGEDGLPVFVLPIPEKIPDEQSEAAEPDPTPLHDEPTETILVPPADESVGLEVESVSGNVVYVLSAELMSEARNAGIVNSALGNRYDASSASGGAMDGREVGEGTRRDSMDADAVQLLLPVVVGENLAARAAFVIALFFAVGFGLEILNFKRKV